MSVEQMQASIVELLGMQGLGSGSWNKEGGVPAAVEREQRTLAREIKVVVGESVAGGRLDLCFFLHDTVIIHMQRSCSRIQNAFLYLVLAPINFHVFLVFCFFLLLGETNKREEPRYSEEIGLSVPCHPGEGCALHRTSSSARKST